MRFGETREEYFNNLTHWVIGKLQNEQIFPVEKLVQLHLHADFLSVTQALLITSVRENRG